MYDTSDPRSALASAKPTAVPSPTTFAGAELGLFYDTPPQEQDANGRTWWARGQNFVLAYTDAAPGAVFARKGQRDEYVVIVPDPDTPVSATAGAQTETVDGYSLVVMPPGDGMITLPKGGRIVRLFFEPDARAQRQMRQRGLLRHRPPQPAALPGVAGAERRLQDPHLLPRRPPRAGPLRPHLALHDGDGELPRAPDRPA